jgi:hypothetical protein
MTSAVAFPSSLCPILSVCSATALPTLNHVQTGDGQAALWTYTFDKKLLVYNIVGLRSTCLAESGVL